MYIGCLQHWNVTAVYSTGTNVYRLFTALGMYRLHVYSTGMYRLFTALECIGCLQHWNYCIQAVYSCCLQHRYMRLCYLAITSLGKNNCPKKSVLSLGLSLYICSVGHMSTLLLLRHFSRQYLTFFLHYSNFGVHLYTQSHNNLHWNVNVMVNLQ